MKTESENKAERILSLYTKLKQGKIVNKESEGIDFGVSSRTIQRDLSDIQCFLDTQNASTGEVEEIIFDKSKGGYILKKKANDNLTGEEILAVSKVLLESRSLMKTELMPIIHKLINLCGDENKSKLLENLLRNEMFHYVELQHGKNLLNRLWLLEQAVKNQKSLKVKYKKLSMETVERKIKPVGVMFSDFYFYLTAYIEDIDKEEKFQNPDDTYPTIYRVDRLLEIDVLNEHFTIPYANRFEEGEFKKRVQFMYGGKLQKIQIECKEQSMEAVLDRLPTAKIVSEMDGKSIITAEVFGKGIELWIEGQGDFVKRI